MANPSDPSADDAEAADDSGARKLTDLLLDAFVYAPIGLTLDGQELTPELARRGRQHAAAARQIGEFAVKTGLQRLDGMVASRVAPNDAEDKADRAPRAERATESSADKATTAVADEADTADDVADVPTSEHLAIPDYDLLAASQVVRRLDGLDPDQLEAVRIYEAATRDRRTILHKIARLQD